MSPIQNQGVPAILFCFLYLYMAALAVATGASTPCFDAKNKDDRKREIDARER